MVSLSCGVDCGDGHCDDCCEGYCDGLEEYPPHFFTDQQELEYSLAQRNAMYAAHIHAAIAAAREKARYLRLHPPPKSAKGPTRPRSKKQRYRCTGTLAIGGPCGRNGKLSVMERHLAPVDMAKHQAAGGCDGGHGFVLMRRGMVKEVKEVKEVRKKVVVVRKVRDSNPVPFWSDGPDVPFWSDGFDGGEKG